MVLEAKNPRRGSFLISPLVRDLWQAMLHDGSVCDSHHMQDREQRASADRRWASCLVRPALISSEGNGLPHHLTHLPSTKLLKLNHQASCLWAFGRQNQSISSPLRIWSTGAGSGVCSPQAFIEHFLLPGFLQELLSQETCLSCSLLFGSCIWQWDRTANKCCLLQHDGSPVTQRKLFFATTLFLKVGTF